MCDGISEKAGIRGIGRASLISVFGEGNIPFKGSFIYGFACNGFTRVQ
jgi:hypothetical protein